MVKGVMDILAPVILMLGLVKICSSKSLVSITISMEMMMVAIFSLFSQTSGMGGVHSVVGFLVIVVLEGVISLLIIVSLFRESGVGSKFSLFF